MKSQQFVLKLKKERIYSERIVELCQAELKYFKKEKPNETRFSAKLSDIIFFEKNRNNLPKYKICISSKTESFPMIKFKSLSNTDINPLLLFKNALENHINSDKTKKKKKEEIVMRINKEITNVINTEEENIKNPRLSQKLSLMQSQKLRQTQLKSNSFILDGNIKQGIEKFLPEKLEKFEIDIKKYDQVFKYDYKVFKKDDDILITTTDLHLIYHNFHNKSNHSLSLNSLNFDLIKKKFESFFSFSFTSNSFVNVLFSFLFAILLFVKIYYGVYFPILFCLTIYSLLKFEFNEGFNFDSIQSNINDILFKNDFKGRSFCIRSETVLSINMFNLFAFLDNKNYFAKWNQGLELNNENNLDLKLDDFRIENIIAKYYYNSLENKLIVAQSVNNELLNLYILETNQSLTKTKITFLAVMKEEYPEIYCRLVLNKLNNFVDCVRYEILNKIYFKTKETSSTVDLYLKEYLDFDNVEEKKIEIKHPYINKLDVEITQENKKNEVTTNNEVFEDACTQENKNKEVTTNNEVFEDASNEIINGETKDDQEYKEQSNNIDIIDIPLSSSLNFLKIDENFSNSCNSLKEELKNKKKEELVIDDKQIIDLFSDSNGGKILKHIYKII
jgi:hypothetical protein